MRMMIMHIYEGGKEIDLYAITCVNYNYDYDFEIIHNPLSFRNSEFRIKYFRTNSTTLKPILKTVFVFVEYLEF